MRNDDTTGRFRPNPGFLMRLAVAAVVVMAAASAAISANAQGGAGMGGPGGGHGMMMFGGPPERIARVVDHMLDGLNATDGQRSQIKQIALAAAADLKAQREAGRGLQEKSMQIFAAPSVDAAAAESLRQQMLAQHDQASKRTLQAMLDVSSVLTAEQRAKIGERMKARMQRDPRPRPQQ